MFYDVNIPYPNISDAKELERIEKILDRIYSIEKKSIIALNLSLENNVLNVKKIDAIAPNKFKYMQQLTRATLIVEDPKTNYQLSQSSAYPLIDVLAVRPMNMDICKHACQTLEIDLISLDLTKSKIVPGFVPAQVAVERGIFFEICYTQSLRDDKKFIFYSNVKRLVEVTRGHNLIFSSEALRALEIKRPTDLRILGSMFGMTHDQIEATATVNYPRLLKKAETRKLTYNATVSLDMEQVLRVEENSLKRKEVEPANTRKSKKQKNKK